MRPDSIPPEILHAKRLLNVKNSRDDFLNFVRTMNPDPEDPDNPEKSRFIVKPHHRLISEALEEVERGEILRLAISIGPQHGKSEQTSRLFTPYLIGRKPWRNVMFGTYSQDFANDFGAQVRSIILDPIYSSIFPRVELRKDSKAKDHLVTTQNGQLSFLGRGGAGTGKPADIFIIDDPIKDDIEAQSDTTREQVFQWFSKVAYTRCHSASAIIIVQTRWHEDDLIGRLVDPEHPNYNEDIAKQWTYINLPSVVTDEKLADALGIKLETPDDPAVIQQFGEKPMAALWPERFSLRHLASAKQLNPAGFSALYQGSPSPEEGDYFQRDWIRYYKPADLPKNLRYYAASDHAVSTKAHADWTVLGCVGIDDKDDIYVMPDLVWEKFETDRTVEEMIALMKRRKPELWFAEADVIKKSIGPFLRKRMREEKVYVPVYDMATAKTDKVMRARSLQGRMAMGKVFLPLLAPWTQKAVQQLLKFPNASHDDFVDFLAWIGLGLDSEHASTAPSKAGSRAHAYGTFGWLKWQTKRKEIKFNPGSVSPGW